MAIIGSRAKIVIDHDGVKDARKESESVIDVRFRWVSQTRTNNVDPIAVNSSRTGFTMPVNG